MQRADLGDVIGALIADLAGTVPEVFGALDAARVLVVVGAARRTARASIRPLGAVARLGPWDLPEVTLGDLTMKYEITLRPLFFRATTPERRVATIAHELWHIGPAFDGALSAERRHVVARGEQVEAAVSEAVSAWRARSREVSRLMGALTVPGEYWMRAWLDRPPSRIPRASRVRRKYGEHDLYSAIVELV